MGEAAFILSGLKRVELAGIKQWEANSFSLCSGLKYFALKRCDFIPEGTFKHDICLSDVIFEEPVETIDATAFYDCRNFHDIRYMYWDFSIDDTHSEMGKHDIIIDELYQQKNAYKRILKYARIILGSYLELEEDEEDMVTAGQLYSNIRDKKISIEKIFSIYPSEAVEILENGKIPVLSAEEVKLQIRDGEVLHYMESGILYLSNNEEFQIDRGALYITSQRILFATGSKTYEILLKQLAKVVLYDAMPEILEIQGIDKVLFVQTAAVEQTYAFLKIIANFTESEDINDNTEKISLDYFKNADMNTYICGLKTLSETDMPDDMHQNMILMIGALEKYNAALEKYPSYSQQADRFMDYYIPEVIKLVFDFQEYEKAGISEQKINPVHSKVKASIYKVTSAAIQGLDEIYKSATMNTVARAEALREILGQDGFVDPDHKIQ